MLLKLLHAITALLIVLVVGILLLWFLITQPFVKMRPWHGESASASMLKDHVRKLAEILPERSDDLDKLNASAEYIHAQLRMHGAPEYQTFEVWGLPYRNVLLRFDRGAEMTVTVGAHYDAFGGLPGADDNASGVAGLLELARLISNHPPQLNVELVAYALEEPPYFGTGDMGSVHHSRVSDAEVTIVLEMIGYFRDEPNSQRYPSPILSHLYSDVGNFVAIVGRFQEIATVRTVKGAFLGAANIPVYSLTFVPIVPGVSFSDHSSYWAMGKKAIMVTDTAFERNPYYHTREDTLDKLDFHRMAEVVNAVYASLFAFAAGS